MNRFGKRSMENPVCPRKGVHQLANDSASQSFVTVRQIFSDGPAGTGRATDSHFGGDPFLIRRLHDLAGGTDEHRASI